jgi:hypothetical protein
MLAGVPPFDEDRSQPEPLPIADLAPGVSPAIDAAIRQALATEPEQRFAGVLEFARALREGVEGASPEAVRRLGDGQRGTNGRERETVSPFFNPLQGAAGALRRVATGTAKLRTLAGEGTFWPARASARIALAGGLLLLAFFGAAFVMRRPARAPVAATAPVEAPSPPPAAPPSPAGTTVAIEPLGPPMGAGQEQGQRNDQAGGAVAPAEDSEAEPDDRAAAWARLATGRAPTKTKGSPAPKVVPTTKIVASATRPSPRPGPAKPAAAAPASAAAAGGGSCVMTVGSRPPADVLVDEKSIGRRTPIVKYRLPCGDHKLVLRRADLDIYQMEVITLRAGVPFRKVYPLQ